MAGGVVDTDGLRRDVSRGGREEAVMARRKLNVCHHDGYEFACSSKWQRGTRGRRWLK